MVDDRTLYAGRTEKFRILEEAIEYTTTYDEEVGSKFKPQDSTVATPLMSEKKDTKKIAERPKLKHVTCEEQVGPPLSSLRSFELLAILAFEMDVCLGSVQTPGAVSPASCQCLDVVEL